MTEGYHLYRLPTPRPGQPLSAREQQIIGHLRHGDASKEIARELGITAKTCDNHIYRIYAKTGVNSRLRLVALEKES